SPYLNSLGVLKAYKSMIHLKNSRPEHVLIVDYYDLVLDYNTLISIISQFLSVDVNGFKKEESILTSNSAHGNDIKSKRSGLSYSSSYSQVLNRLEISFFESVFRFYFDT